MKAKSISVNDLLTSPQAADQVKSLSFEDGLKLLEELVEKVESGGLALDRAVSSYERGTILLNHLRELLSGAEKKLEIIDKSAPKTGRRKEA